VSRAVALRQSLVWAPLVAAVFLPAGEAVADSCLGRRRVTAGVSAGLKIRALSVLVPGGFLVSREVG
jgi:hypothetical protein